MKKLVLFASLVLCASLIGCSNTKEIDTVIVDNEPVENEQIENEQYENILGMKTTLDKSAYFLDSLYDGHNIMFSSLSLDLALGLASNGANDETKEQFENYFGTSIEQYNDFAESYMSNKSESVKIANSLWIKSNYMLNDDMKNIAEDKYNADIIMHDFDDAVVKDINDWCAEKTDNMITELISEKPSFDTLLLNTLYFNSDWEKAFNKNEIVKDTFTLFNDTEVETDMMHSTETIYLENDFATGFIKPYKDNKYSFIGVLPKKHGNFNLVELDLDNLLLLRSNEEVIVEMPKFEFESSFLLNNMLRDNGLNNMFELNSFDKIIANDTMNISDVLQKTKIIVDENGTEASASTAMSFQVTSINQEIKEPKHVELNRPFVFIIYDEEAKLPLFIGKYVMP